MTKRLRRLVGQLVESGNVSAATILDDLQKGRAITKLKENLFFTFLDDLQAIEDLQNAWVGEKACNVCHEVKALEEFHRNREGKLGRRPECKDCIREKRYGK